MIRAEKGAVEVKGEPSDVIFELTNLLYRLIEKNPNIITALLAVYTDELSYALTKVNPHTYKVVTDLAMRFKKDLEDE